MSIDLALRYLVIAIAAHIACAWMQTFQSPWPLVDAFELAGNVEEQLFQSLGFSLRNLKKTLSIVSNGVVAVRRSVAVQIATTPFTRQPPESCRCWLARDDGVKTGLRSPNSL